jgi:hypothetical protein
LAREHTLGFVWFWTFWHWSAEGFRSGALLRSPLHGIGSHWDEWFRNEASSADREAIESAGRSRFEQRRFVCWLARRWAREAQWRGDAPPARYVLAQLSRVSPFDSWPAFEKYRTTYGAPGISAIVLDEDSQGESADVRAVEAVALPADEDGAAPTIISEGFHAESGDLNAARKGAMGMLAGRGLLVFLALWVIGGRRAYPRWLTIGLSVAWLTVAGLIVRVLAGSDPGNRLTLILGILFGLWSALVLTALATATGLSVQAWRVGRNWKRQLERSQTRLRINGGLALQGGSAGFAFLLNTLLSTYRAQPRSPSRSWLWERFFRRLRSDGKSWAATGAVNEHGAVERVVLEPKLRACLRHPGILHVLTPWQPEASQVAVDHMVRGRVELLPDTPPAGSGMTLAFASETRRLRSHRCIHAAQSIMAIGGFTSGAQMAVNALAVAVSTVMLAALPDLRNVLIPPPSPAVVPPSSPSPYYLWVSLDTKHPEAFTVSLESGFWANRRADVGSYEGADGSVRAELRLNRVGIQTTGDEEDGTVRIERRRKLLTREFEPGERVGSYSFSHITRLGHE